MSSAAAISAHQIGDRHKLCYLQLRLELDRPCPSPELVWPCAAVQARRTECAWNTVVKSGLHAMP